MSSSESARTRLIAVLVDNPKYVEYCALTMVVFMTLVATTSVVLTHVQGDYLSEVVNVLAAR